MIEMPSNSIHHSNSEITSIVNDFNITFGTVNGSGSATANTTLLRALFKMGIPVSGKNIFPSNIQGQPTWYTIRVSKDGYIARHEREDIVVAMNPASFTRDVECLVSNGVLFYADDIQIPINRSDIVAYPMPVKSLAKEADINQNLRDYIANMAYVGIVAQMLGIDMEKIYQALEYHFKGKQKPINANYSMVEKAANWAAQNLTKIDRYHIEKIQACDGCIMADGNTAAALGALYGGLQFVGWYPITPATSLSESINEYLPELRKDSLTGKNTCVVVQAEDELAAIGMVVGAGWAGLRSMTSTSGPGFSLMAEYLSLAYFAEVPLVVWDVQRVGPSTGLPTRTAQSDINFAYFIGHGDTRFILLFPGSVNECFEFGWKAFDLAERLQSPVIVLSDLDLGMNQWMTPQFKYPEKPMDRGKVLWEQDLEKLKERWGRYLDVDGDGIPYRTLPGNLSTRSAYFGRGTGHDEYAQYSEEPEVWERVLDRIRRKYETAKDFVPTPIIETMENASFGLIAFGSTDPAVEEARDRLEKEGISTDYMRLRAFPFQKEVSEFIQSHKANYVIEMNQDGQMKQLLTLNFPEDASKLIQLSHSDGLPLTASWIVDGITSGETRK
jgi:2-oxoglutarate/2-oxoacid ferredoxin oxidoreductase subunit alpha